MYTHHTENFIVQLQHKTMRRTHAPLVMAACFCSLNRMQCCHLRRKAIVQIQRHQIPDIPVMYFNRGDDQVAMKNIKYTHVQNYVIS